jgi:ankyrin repeat protein
MIVLALASAFVVAANASEALHEAAKQNDVNKVQELLKDPDVDVDYPDEDGYTALMMAAIYNDATEVVTQLIDAGANPDTTAGSYGYTALKFASNQDHDGVVAILSSTRKPTPGPTSEPTPGPTSEPTPGPTTNPTQAASDNCDSKIFQSYAETSFMVKTKDEAKKLIAKVKKAFKTIKESYRAAKFNLRQLGREAKE